MSAAMRRMEHLWNMRLMIVGCLRVQCLRTMLRAQYLILHRFLCEQAHHCSANIITLSIYLDDKRKQAPNCQAHRLTTASESYAVHGQGITYGADLGE